MILWKYSLPFATKKATRCCNLLPTEKFSAAKICCRFLIWEDLGDDNIPEFATYQTDEVPYCLSCDSVYYNPLKIYELSKDGIVFDKEATGSGLSNITAVLKDLIPQWYFGTAKNLFPHSVKRINGFLCLWILRLR